MELATDIKKVGGALDEEDNTAKEEDYNVRKGLSMKRRHFFVMCIFVAIFLMIKLEFSYKKIFS